MKKIISLLVLATLLTFRVSAQKSFQGTIQYKMSFSGEGLEMYQAMMPTGYTLQTRKGSTRSEMTGGMMAEMTGITISMPDGEAYMIKDAEKKAYRFSKDAQADETAAKPIVTREDEVVDLLGYPCQKYRVIMTQQGQEVEMMVWAASALNISMPKNSGTVSGLNLVMEGVEGTVLKVMMTQQGMTIVVQAEKVKPGKLSSKLFKVPAGYKVEEYTPDPMGM